MHHALSRPLPSLVRAVVVAAALVTVLAIGSAVAAAAPVADAEPRRAGVELAPFRWAPDRTPNDV